MILCHMRLVRHYHVLGSKVCSATRPTLRKLSPSINSPLSSVLITRTITSNPNEIVDFSQQAISNGTDISSGFLPPPPALTEHNEVVLNALGEPTLASLGLTSWTPPGLIQSLMENIHITFDMPWFASIMISTLILRTLVFPISVIQRRSMINMANHNPTLQKLQKQTMEASQSGDQALAQKLAKEAFDYMERNDIKFSRMLSPLLLAPVFISVFWGVTGMTTLPVEALQTGGTLWFTDLCIRDPYYGLPALNGFIMYYVLNKGAEGISPESMPPQLRTLNKLLPIGTSLFCLFQPSAIVLYWMTSNIISLLFNELLKIQSVKSYFKIPDQVVHSKEDMDITNPFEKLKEAFGEKPDKQEIDFNKLKSSDLSQMDKFKMYKRLTELQHEMNDREKVGALKFTQNKAKEWPAPKHIKDKKEN